MKSMLCLLLLLGSWYLWSMQVTAQAQSPITTWMQCLTVLYVASDWVAEPTHSIWTHVAHMFTHVHTCAP